jgi:hypothetical protein
MAPASIKEAGRNLTGLFILAYRQSLTWKGGTLVNTKSGEQGLPI